MYAYFIVNPNSGSGNGQKVWERTEGYLKSSGIRYEVAFTTGRGDAERIASGLSSGKSFHDAHMIVVIGGDGTVNEALNGLDLESGMLFGFIPGGSGNDLSRSLGISNDDLEHTKSMLSGENILEMDIGELSLPDGRVRRFAVSAGINFDAAVCEHIDRSKLKSFFNKIGCGTFVYGAIGFIEYLKTVLLPCTVTDDSGKKYEFQSTFFASFQVHPFEGGGFRFAPKAKWNDGKLELCVTHAKNRLELAPVLLQGKGKNGLPAGTVATFISTSHAGIRFPAECCVHSDGEVLGHYSGFEARCMKEKLRMPV